MKKVIRIEGKWRLTAFAILHGLAFLLMASWIWPVTRHYWDALDAVIFHALNSTLDKSSIWASIWAFGSIRISDAVVALVLLLFIARKDIVFKKYEVRPALFMVLSLLAMLMVFRKGFEHLVTVYDLQRASPSRILEGTVLLSEMFPTMAENYHLKDSSGKSFPGDHAAVLLVWACFMAVFARGKTLILLSCVTILFIVPRLIAGAHWFTDAFVGGLFIALLVLAWGYCTPAAAQLARLMEFVSKPFIIVASHIPGLKRLSLLRRTGKGKALKQP